MKPLLCLLLALLVPTLCRGESVSLTDAPDWQPMADAQKEAVLKAFKGNSVRLIDGSLRTGGGGATFTAMDLAVTGKAMYDHEVSEYIRGVLKSGIKMVDRRTETLAGLPGFSAAFQGQANGSDLFILTYQFFTNRDVYAIAFYTDAPLARTDPMVTSYLARIKLDPSVKPADIHGTSPLAGLPTLSGPPLNDTSSYALGYRFGQLLMLAIVIFVIVKCVAAASGSRKREPTPPPCHGCSAPGTCKFVSRDAAASVSHAGAAQPRFLVLLTPTARTPQL